MPIEPGDSGRARELGKASGRVRRKLTLADVEAALPPALDSPEAVRVSVQKIRDWACARLLAGSMASAAVRACEVALKALDSAATFEAIEELRKSVRRLQAERDAALREVERLQLAARPRLVP